MSDEVVGGEEVAARSQIDTMEKQFTVTARTVLARTARFTSFLLLPLALPIAAQTQFAHITNNTKITITKYTGTGGSVLLPDSINGLPVTEIAKSAFRRCESLTSVIMGTNVTSIGAYAFDQCRNLASATIGPNVTSIGFGAFMHCRNLTSLTMGTNVTSIGTQAFSGCASLPNITIPNGIIKIGICPLSYCSKLTSVTIQASFTTTNTFAFPGCPCLTNVTLGQGVTNIGARAFIDCHTLTGITVDPLNPVYSSLDGVLFNKSRTLLIQYPGGRTGTYTIPSGVLRIGNSAFESCLGLSGVTIPNSVINIGDFAFSDCIGLNNVTVGTRVTSIGISAFSGNSKLTSITLPESVTNVGNSAFSWCRNVTNANIPKTLTDIGKSTFYYCPKLASLMFPSGITKIRAETFPISEQAPSERKERTLFEKKQDSLVLKVVTWEAINGELRVATEAWLQARALFEARRKLPLADADLARVLHYDLWALSNGLPIGVVWQNIVEDTIGVRGMRRFQVPGEAAPPPESPKELEERALNSWCGVRDANYDAHSQEAVVAYSNNDGRLLVDFVERSRSAAVLTKLPRLRTSHAGGRYLHWPLARIFTGC